MLAGSAEIRNGLGEMRAQIAEFEELLAARGRDRLFREVKYQLAALRFEAALIRRAHVCRKAGFNPDQPRVPAGSSDGGKWTSDGGSDEPAPDTDAIRVTAQSVQFCNNQLIIDNLKCNQLQPAWWRAAYRNQAMERYAACLVGRPLPPLPFFDEE